MNAEASVGMEVAVDDSERRTIMKERTITLPELMLVAATRAALGAGLGLLLADRLNEAERRAVGWTLFLVGALTTIPLAMEVLGRDSPAQAQRDGLVPA